MSTKKVLLLSQLPPPHHGAAYINSKILEILSTSSFFKVDSIPLQLSDKLTEIGRLSPKKIIKIFLFFIKLISSLIKNPDLVYFTATTSGYSFLRDICIATFVKVFDIKIIYHMHGKGIKEKSKCLLNRLLYNYLFSNAAIITVSPILAQNEFIRLKLKNSTLYSLENTVETIKINYEKKKNTSNSFHFLFLSNLMPSKGIFILLDAIKLLNNNLYNIHFDIVGGDFDTKITHKIKQKASVYKIDHLITFHGALYGKKKHEILLHSNCLVHPTLNDSFGLVILEAMQFSLPVISTFEGGIPHIINHDETGILVKAGDATELSKAMKKIYMNPSLSKRMGRNGFLRFNQVYTTSIFERNFLNIMNLISHSLSSK